MKQIRGNKRKRGAENLRITYFIHGKIRGESEKRSAKLFHVEQFDQKSTKIWWWSSENGLVLQP